MIRHYEGLTMSKFFNPIQSDLEEAESSKDNNVSASDTISLNLESTSGLLIHKGPSVCPKCGNTMGTARIANDEEVYHCIKCRVSSPLPV